MRRMTDAMQVLYKQVVSVIPQTLWYCEHSQEANCKREHKANLL